ncbi:MAG: Ryanodine receptor Ryr [Bacteroidaceae bacterium]|nr:Ryanodine receptor Ryr [Bacteroidaceae bacterium]
MSLADVLAASEANGIQATDTIEYVPQCTSTDDFTLPDELTELVEKMAENVHEEWAQERIRQGWTYGKERNDTLKQHPCLVPYEELPEEEKQFDRITSIKTLQFIISQGFKITRNADR